MSLQRAHGEVRKPEDGDPENRQQDYGYGQQAKRLDFRQVVGPAFAASDSDKAPQHRANVAAKGEAVHAARRLAHD